MQTKETVADPSGRRLARVTDPSRRRLRRVAVVLAVVVVAIGVGLYAWVQMTSGARQVGEPCERTPVTGASGPVAEQARAGVCATMTGLAEAWNRGDAPGYGAFFTKEATYVSVAGSVYQGRDDIVTSHAALFAGVLEGTTIGGGRYLGIDVVAPGVARVVGRGDDAEDGTPSDDAAEVQTYVLVDQGAGWRVAAFANTPRSTLMERLQFTVDPGSVPLRER